MQRAYSVDTGAQLLTAATAAYILGITTVASTPVDIVELVVGCDATTAGSVKVELLTATGAGTGSSAYTPKPQNTSARMVAAATTAGVGYTVAPTTLTVIRTWDFPTPTAPFDLMLPIGREISVPISTLVYLRFTSVTVAPNVYATLVFEE
jgi:hypothetical protein